MQNGHWSECNAWSQFSICFHSALTQPAIGLNLPLETSGLQFGQDSESSFLPWPQQLLQNWASTALVLLQNISWDAFKLICDARRCLRGTQQNGASAVLAGSGLASHMVKIVGAGGQPKLGQVVHDRLVRCFAQHWLLEQWRTEQWDRFLPIKPPSADEPDVIDRVARKLRFTTHPVHIGHTQKPAKDCDRCCRQKSQRIK